jgi:hypothetical protein
MIDGLGVLGWGVGGIEAEAVMLGQVKRPTFVPIIQNIIFQANFNVAPPSGGLQNDWPIAGMCNQHGFSLDDYKGKPTKCQKMPYNLSIFARMGLWANLLNFLVRVWPICPLPTGLPLLTCALNMGPLWASSLSMSEPLSKFKTK